MRTRALSLALFTLLPACVAEVGPDSGVAERRASAESTLVEIPPGALDLSPVVECASTTPDAVFPLASPGPSTGTSKPGACDWYVTELTDAKASGFVLGFQYSIAPLLDLTADDCAGTSFEAYAYGYRAGVWINGVLHRGGWELIDGFKGAGCFPGAGYGYLGNPESSPYTKLRVATRYRVSKGGVVSRHPAAAWWAKKS